MEEMNESIQDRFRGRGLRHTRQREVIYSALLGLRTHPTAEELFDVVRGGVEEGEEGLSLATVYNTLDALVSSGLCRRIASATGSGSCRYDADVSEHVHVQAEDGRVLDLPTDLSDRLLAALTPDVRREIERRCGVKLDRVAVQLSGFGVGGGAAAG